MLSGNDCTPLGPSNNPRLAAPTAHKVENAGISRRIPKKSKATQESSLRFIAWLALPTSIPVRSRASSMCQSMSNRQAALAAALLTGAQTAADLAASLLATAHAHLGLGLSSLKQGHIESVGILVREVGEGED